MWKSSKIVFLIFALLISSLIKAQPMKENLNYLMFPIKPGERNSLAGTMGELRSTHFHTGIDIRTEGRQGLPVFAAANGYISRIAVSPSGYGNALYILHPNGQTTVYAHLKEFSDEINRYVRSEQYRNKKFAVNLFPTPDQFIVERGDTIALSGNSGSSGGPHLHFDLRDENHALLNPLSYGFDEIIDTRTPFAKTIALVAFSENSRINGQFGRVEFNVKQKGSGFIVPDTIRVSGKFGIELFAWDRMNGTRFKTGINTIKVNIDDEVLFEQHINTWTFSKSRYFYQHINYASLVNNHKRFHKLYVDDGNNLNFYDPVVDKGLIIPKPGKVYNVRITMQDSYGNESALYLVLQGETPGKVVKVAAADSTGVKRFNHFLKITTSLSEAKKPARFYTGSKRVDKTPAYSTDSMQAVYIWDLNNSLPDSMLVGKTRFLFKIKSRIPAEHEFKVYNEFADIIFKKSSLFDTLFLSLDHQIDSLNNLEILTIGDGMTPLKSNIKVIFKPERISEFHDKTDVYQWYGGNNFGFVGGEWKADRITFDTRSLGRYTLLTDSLAPKVKPLIINKDKVVFQISDDLSGINKFTASLNDEWLLMYYDPKTRWIWAEKLDDSQNYIGALTVQVEDNAGNIQTYQTNIN